MKKSIIKFSLLTLLFLVFLVGWILQFIQIIELFAEDFSGTNSEIYTPTLNLHIPTIVDYLFGLFTIMSTLTSYIGYKVVQNAIHIYREYKLKYADKIAAQKAARAEADKQAKIAQLEAELKELKKD